MKFESKATTRNILIKGSRVALAFLRWITFGKVDLAYERRTTTLGRTMYTGTGWKTKDLLARAREINHEEVHVQQWATWGPLYYLTYLMNIWHVLAVPVLILTGVSWWVWLVVMIAVTAFPAGLSLRAYWEYKAFQVTLLIRKNQGLRFHGYQDIEYYTNLICGAPYLYAALFITPIIRRRWHCFIEGLTGSKT